MEVGAISFKAVIDTSNLRGEIARVNSILSRETLRLRLTLDTTAVDRELARVRNTLAQAGKLNLAATTPVATAAQPQGRFARDFDAAIARQAREAAVLAREFDRTAQSAERAANQAARIQITRQEREAAALARELQKSEQAAARASAQAQRLSFAKQQREVERFAQEFEKAAAAQQRLQQQTSRDQNILSGANFSSRELQNIEAALKRVNAETQKTDQVAALLRQKYGLADAEARKLAGTMGQVGRQNNALAQTLDQFGNNLLAKFFSIQAAIGAVQSAINALTGTLAEASQSFKEFETAFLGFQSKTQELDASGLENFDRLFKDVASTTSFTPAQIADTAAQLRALGVEVEGVEANLSNIAKVSDVLKENPVLTGKVVQGSLAAYGRFGETAESVLELFTQSINTTAAGATSGLREFEQLNSKAAGIAANLGVSNRELVTFFALLRETGATAQVSATTIETLLTRIASKRSEFAREGIELAFKETGALDLEKSLIAIGERIQGLSQTAQIEFLTPLLGLSGASDVFKAIANVEEGFARVDAAIGDTAGSIERTFDIVASGTEFQAGVLGGVLTAAFTELGEAINPVEKALLALQQNVIAASNVDLSPLSDSASRFAAVLGGNDELVQALADALSSFADVAVQKIADVIDALTSLSVSESLPETIAEVGKSIEVVAIALGRFFQGAIGFIEITSGLFAPREVLPGVETSLFSLANTLSRLLDPMTALQEFIRIIPEGARAFATAIGTLVDRLIDAVPGLRIAIEALRLLRGEVEKPIEMTGGAATGATSGAAAAVDGLNAFSTAVNEARDEVNEGDPIGPTFKAPEEGLSAKDGLKRFRDELANTLADIERDSAVAEAGLLEAGADPDAFLANEQTALDDRIAARETYIEGLQELLQKTEKTVAEELQLGRALSDAERDLAKDRLQSLQLVQRGRQETLDELRRTSQLEVAELEKAAAAANLLLSEQTLGAEDRAAAETAIEQQTLQQRLANREQFLKKLQEQERQGGLSPEQARALGQEIIQVETEILNQRVELARQGAQARLDAAQRGNQRELAAIERQAAEAALVLAQSPLSNRDRANAEAAAEQQALQQRIANRQQFLDQLKALEAQGGLSADQALALSNQIVGVEQELLNQRLQLSKGFESERKRIAEQGFSDQLLALSQFKEQEDVINQQRVGALNDQQRLLQAETSLASTRNQLDQAQLNTALALANVQGNIAGAVNIQRQAAEAQLKGIEAEFRSKRQSLVITQQLTRLEAQRAIQSAEVAALEADIAARRAQSQGATQQEVDGLRAIAELRASQVDDARASAAITDQILAKQREELGLQEKISAEQLRQNNIAEAGNRLANARKGIISALAQENNTSTEDSLNSLNRIQDRLRDARRAGLFQGEDVQGAIRQTRQALRGSNDQQLFRLAQQNNPLINQLLQAAGRSDITGLVEADREVQLAKAVEDGNAAIVNRLDQLIEQGLGARIEQLVVQTPDPVADTSRIVSDVANLQTQGVNP